MVHIHHVLQYNSHLIHSLELLFQLIPYHKKVCVIVGRCADYILRDRDDCFNVFICSDLDKKVERIVRLYGETDEKPEKRLADKDKKRRANYKYYTDQVWGLAQNYHLCLNSGEIGIDKCTELIVDLVK